MLQNGSDLLNIVTRLYTVRDVLSKGLNTLHQLSEIDYRYIKIAGTGILMPSESSLTTSLIERIA